jgi:hypothetical protein
MVELILTADKKEFPGFDKLVLDAEKARFTTIKPGARVFRPYFKKED